MNFFWIREVFHFKTSGYSKYQLLLHWMCSLSLQPNVCSICDQSQLKLKRISTLFRDLRWQVTSLLPLTTPLQSFLSLSFPTPSHWILQPLNVWTILVSALCLGSRIHLHRFLGCFSGGGFFVLILPLPYFKGLILVRERKNPPGPETNIFWWTLWVCTLFSSVHYTVLMPTSIRISILSNNFSCKSLFSDEC